MLRDDRGQDVPFDETARLATAGFQVRRKDKGRKRLQS